MAKKSSAGTKKTIAASVQPPAAAQSGGTATSAKYRLEVDRGVQVIIQFDFTVYDSQNNQYVYSLRDFDEEPKILSDILAAIAKTWPNKDAIQFRYENAQAGVVAQIVEIL